MSFAEQQMRRGKYYDQPPFPFVSGYDLVGTVTAVGPDADPALLGRRVAALTKTGAWASAVVLDADDLVPVPDGVDPAEAETLVVNGATAWQMLNRIGRVRRGDTILVLGGNGGVGTTLVQLARIAGLRVIGTATPRHHDSVPALGAIPLDDGDPAPADRVRELALTASTRWSTTSAAPASSPPTGCSPAAARSSPTAPPRPATRPGPPGCRS